MAHPECGSISPSTVAVRYNAPFALKKLKTDGDTTSMLCHLRRKHLKCSLEEKKPLVRRGARPPSRRAAMRFAVLPLLLALALASPAAARRGRTRGRTKSRAQIGLPVTGQYRDAETDKYYNNNNGAKIVTWSHFDLEYTLGQKIVFVCVAKGNPRPAITWFKDGTELYAHSYLHVHEWAIGKEQIKSKLEIDPATQMDAGVYECSADNMYSIDRRSFKTDFSIAFD